MKKYKIVVAPEANARMFDHFKFLARVSEKAAKNLLNELYSGIKSLAQMPLRNPVYDRPFIPSGKYRYLLVPDRYRIVYQISASTVYVDDIQDCRQSDKLNSESIN